MEALEIRCVLHDTEIDLLPPIWVMFVERAILRAVRVIVTGMHSEASVGLYIEAATEEDLTRRPRAL